MRRRLYALLLLAALLTGVFMSCFVYTHLFHHVCSGENACPVCLLAEETRLGLAGLLLAVFLAAVVFREFVCFSHVDTLCLPIFFTLVGRNTQMND